MGEIDEIHHAPDQRQARGKQRIDGAEQKPTDDDLHDHHRLLRPTYRVGPYIAPSRSPAPECATGRGLRPDSSCVLRSLIGPPIGIRCHRAATAKLDASLTLSRREETKTKQHAEQRPDVVAAWRRDTCRDVIAGAIRLTPAHSQRCATSASGCEILTAKFVILH